MPAPYDYSIGDVPNPAQSFLQGIQAVDVLRKREQDMADDFRRRNQQMAAERAAQQKQQELQALYAEAMKPDATPDVFERLSFAIDPQKAALAKFQQRTDAQQEAARQNIFSVWSPLLAGKPEVALAKVDQQLSAMKNAEAPAQDIQALQAIRQTIVATPELAQVSLATQLSGMGEKGKTLVNNAWEAFKKPVEQRKAEAEAGEAEAKVKLVGTPTDAQMADWWTKATPAQQKAYLAVQNAKKPPATVVKVENIMDKTGMAEVAKLLPTYQEKMMSSVAQIEKLPEYKAALKNAITGPFAEQRLTGARIANMFGFTGDTALKDTATLVQGLSQQVLDSRSLLTGQGAISNFEQQVLEKAKSGNINMSAKELETLFNVAERSANASYENNERILQAARKRGSQTAEMLLETVPKPSNRVTVDGKTYTRPAQMTDAQWSAYKQSVGAQ